MVKICPECKTQNPDNAEFCQNCGHELKNVKSRNTASSQMSNGKSGWWSRQSTGAKAAIGIVGICCVGLIVLLVFAGSILPDLSTTNPFDTTTTTNTTTSNSNTTQKFSGGGVTFNYPDDWRIDSSGNKTADKIVTIKSDKADTSLLTVYVEDTNEGLEYWKEINRNALSSGDTIIAEGPIKIAGVNGYHVDIKYVTHGGGQQSVIFFVKNNKYYKLLVTTGSIKTIQGDINTVVNSLKTN